MNLFIGGGLLNVTVSVALPRLWKWTLKPHRAAGSLIHLDMFHVQRMHGELVAVARPLAAPPP